MGNKFLLDSKLSIRAFNREIQQSEAFPKTRLYIVIFFISSMFDGSERG